MTTLYSPDITAGRVRCWSGQHVTIPAWTRSWSVPDCSPRTTRRRPHVACAKRRQRETGGGDDGRDRPDRPYVEVPGLRRPAESWITKY